MRTQNRDEAGKVDRRSWGLILMKIQMTLRYVGRD